MANFIDRLGLAIGGVPTQKGQQITPEQRQLSSTALMNAAQALLAASDKSGTSLGGAIGEGLAGAQEGVQNALKAQSDMRTAEMNREINQLNLDKARDVARARKGAPNFSDFDGYNDWAEASADYYFKNNLPEEATKYVSIFKPETQAELRTFVFKNRGKWDKQVDALSKALSNFETVKGLISAGTGGSAYAAMIKVIKALDDSVVRESERAAFDNSFGELQGLENKLQLAAKGEITDVTGSEIMNIAAKSLNAVIRDYRFQAEEKRQTYFGYVPNEQVAYDIIPEFAVEEIGHFTPEMFAKMRAEHPNNRGGKRRYRE